VALVVHRTSPFPALGLDLCLTRRKGAVAIDETPEELSRQALFLVFGYGRVRRSRYLIKRGLRMARMPRPLSFARRRSALRALAVSQRRRSAFLVGAILLLVLIVGLWAPSQGSRSALRGRRVVAT
jgi:hypothetical protein